MINNLPKQEMLIYWYQIYFYAIDLEMYFWKPTFFSDIDQFALVFILNMCWTPLNLNPVRAFLMSFFSYQIIPNSIFQ